MVTRRSIIFDEIIGDFFVCLSAVLDFAWGFFVFCVIYFFVCGVSDK